MPDVRAPAPADPADEADPGAPIPKDAVDPELVSLRPRTQVGLVTAFSILALCVFLAFRLWPDFRYAGEDKPRAVTVDQIRAGQLSAESQVAVPVALERAAAVRVRTARGVPGLRVAPVAGSGDQVWVVLDGDGWDDPRDGDGYTGRLRRLSDLPFADDLRDAVRAQPAPRHVTAEELRRAIDAHDHALTAVTGDAFTVADGDPVDFVIQDPDAVTIVVAFTGRYPDAPTWSKALADAGLIAPGTLPSRTDADNAWYDVHRAGALASSDAALEKAQLFGARVEPVTRRARAPWPLTADATGVTADGATVPWASFQVAAIRTPRPVPDNAWVVLVGETPDHYWYVRPLYVVLGVFAVLFAWAMVRTARRELLAPKAPARA